ncbi:hypothetical protein BJ165DRAFT_1528792 [Panaeolus papilionaceus]|nr:hypothetical protein BJ165DRAFT_1528792 [Panaeolus papilionaceus]
MNISSTLSLAPYLPHIKALPFYNSMSDINQERHLSTSFPLGKIEGVPHRDHSNRDAVSRSSAVSSNGASATSAVRKSIKGERCFVTNAPSVGLQRAHIINAVCPRRAESKDQTKARKDKVEEYLQHLGIVNNDFNLEQCYLSVVTVHPYLHHVMDTYRYFAIVPSASYMRKIRGVLTGSNTKWDRVRSNNPGEEPQRPQINLSQPSLVDNAEYQLLVLYPKQMLKGSHISVYKSDNGPIDGLVLTPWTDYFFVDGAMRECTGRGSGHLPQGLSPPIFGPFARRHDCLNAADNVNPFLVVLLAHIIIRRYIRAQKVEGNHHEVLCEEYQELIDRVGELADLIYYFPTTKTEVPTVQQSPGRNIDPKTDSEGGENGSSGPDHDDHMDVDDWGYCDSGSNRGEEKTITQTRLRRRCADFEEAIDLEYIFDKEEEDSEAVSSDDEVDSKEVDHKSHVDAIGQDKHLRVPKIHGGGEPLESSHSQVASPEAPDTVASPTCKMLITSPGIINIHSETDNLDVVNLTNRVSDWRLNVMADLGM